MPNAHGIEYLVEPADHARRGDLVDLVTTEYPDVHVPDMALGAATRAHLDRVLDEQRRCDLLASRGFTPLRRLLLTGPPGTGKSMSAAALAGELSLPLVTIRIDTLIGRYAGETTPKLRVLYDALARARAVCLFDDFDAIGARLMAGYEPDVVEARRVLNALLSFLDGTQPDSLVVAVTSHRAALGEALLDRFDAVIPYALPHPAAALRVLRRRLAAVDTSRVCWADLGGHVNGLSPAQLVRAAESAAKQAILHEEALLSTAALIAALGEHRRFRQPIGFTSR